VTHTIPLTAMPLLHHTRSVRRASGFVLVGDSERCSSESLPVDSISGSWNAVDTATCVKHERDIV
jgi:hypothetical protein